MTASLSPLTALSAAALGWVLLGLSCSATPPEPEGPAQQPVAMVSVPPPVAAPAGSPAPVAPPEPAPHASADDALSQTAGKSFSQRAHLARCGEVWLRAQGPAQGQPAADCSAQELIVVEESAAARVRLVVPDGVTSARADYRLLLYLSRDDLALVTTARVNLRPAPEPQPQDSDAPGVWLNPGEALTIEAKQPGYAKIRVGPDEDLAASTEERGWIPDRAIGRIYRPGPSFRAPPWNQLHQGAEIRRAPGGDVLKRFTKPAKHVLPLAPPQGGWVKVSFVGWCSGNRRVVGFVPVWAAKLEQRPGGAYGCGRGSGTFGLGKPSDPALTWITLRAGQRLFDQPGGRLIGLVDRDVEVIDDGAPWVKLRTRWGLLRVVAAGGPPAHSQ